MRELEKVHIGEQLEEFVGVQYRNYLTNINTRQSLNFHMFHQNSRTGQKSLFCNGLKIYNKLPQQIKLLNKKSFKNEIIEWTKNQE
jgi:hypothetical protein